MDQASGSLRHVSVVRPTSSRGLRRASRLRGSLALPLMTVIVGYVSRAGAVMASDSQSSEEDATTSQIEKIWTSGRLLLGYSGHLAIREPLRRDIERRLQESPLPPQVPIEIAASMLCAIVRPVLEQAYANFVGAPGDDPAEKLAGSLMVIGNDGAQYWLLE